MKTKLEIDEDLKEYLVEEIDRSTSGNWNNEFNWQWRFRFENDLRS